MADSSPLTVLCITTYEKGQEFMRECKRLGCRVLLLTAEKLRDADWPREVLEDTYYLPEDLPVPHIVSAVSHLARTRKIDRIVALDEFDMETAATLREHMRIPGMGLTTCRYFRDKLAMRMKAMEAGLRVPDFVPVIHHDDIRYYLDHVPGPWVLKPRQEASAIGIKKFSTAAEFWPLLDQLDRDPSNFLIERFVPGEVYHVDSVVSEGGVPFTSVSRYGRPPMDVAHGGGVFMTATVERGGAEEQSLHRENRKLLAGLGLVRGVAHAEFIRSRADGEYYFLECAARVGGAYINEMVEAASGIDLWREWARIEVAAGRYSYQLPAVRADCAAVILCLARQEWPDTSAYCEAEIVYRVNKLHHAGFVLRSPDYARLQWLLGQYGNRFVHDFLAIEPIRDRPAS
jgi:biotin carboxylase